MQLGSAVKQSLWSSAERLPENNPENPYRLRSICLPDIPTAAWLCVIDRASPNALLLHGRSVLVRSDGFVEGGWAGRFDDGDFMSSGFLTGSAGKLSGDAAQFRTATHSLEPLYSTRKPGSFLISNSLLFLISASDLNLRGDYFYYDRDIMSIMFGLNSYTRWIELQAGVRVCLHYCADIKLNRDFSVGVTRNLPRPSFGSFDEYKGYLLKVIGSVLQTWRMKCGRSDMSRCRRSQPGM